MENNSRAPLGDKTNTAKQADAKERKRERDRARWQAKSQEQKNAIYKKRRESYRQREKHHFIGTANDDDTALNKKNVDPMEADDWLHRNDSYQTQNIVDENMTTRLSYDQKMQTTEENTIGFTNTPVFVANKTCVQSTSKSNYMSEWYKNMTPEQREARRERQRLHNTKPKRKVAMKLSQKKFQEARKHTLHSDSIAMENPLFSPMLVWPTTNASGTPGSTAKSSDWVIPESSNTTPLYISPPHEELDDEGYDESLSGHMTQRSHVPFGQRHDLLTRHNTTFERRIGSNIRASNKEGDWMAEDRVDVNTPLPLSAVTNNERAGPNLPATSTTSTAPLFDDCECTEEEHLNDNTPFPESVVTNNVKFERKFGK